MLAFIGLGSNLGERECHLARAVAGLRELDPDLEVSPVYETTPVGGPSGQGPYLNAVVRLETDRTPHELLDVAQQLEREARRVRTEPNAPRTLDVDLLFLDDLEIDDDRLTVPHPRMHERAFVLAPLEDLDPSRVPEGWRERAGSGGLLGEPLRRIGKLQES